MHNSTKPSSSSFSSPSFQSLKDESDHQDITRFDKSLQVHFHLLLSHLMPTCFAVSLLIEFVTTACRNFDTYVLSFIMLPIIPKPLS